MGTNWLWNWRWSVPKTTKIMLVKSVTWPNFWADYDFSACSRLPLSVKAPACWMSGEGGDSASGQASVLSPPPLSWWLASKIKQTFLSINLEPLLASEWLIVGPHSQSHYLYPISSLTQWTWVWVNSGSWWWTGRPGVLQSMGSQRVGHDWATELN